MTKVDVTLLGRFEIAIDGEVVPARNWGRRDPAALVNVLALAAVRKLQREQLIGIMWPDHRVDEASPKLHKAAHYARTATGRGEAIVLRDEMVALFPDAELTVDVDAFDHPARNALSRSDPEAADQAVARWMARSDRRIVTRGGPKTGGSRCLCATSSCSV